MRIVLASKSGVRKKILDDHSINAKVIVSNVDEDEVKNSLLAEGANPSIISKNLAEIKSIKVSSKNPEVKQKELETEDGWKIIESSIKFSPKVADDGKNIVCFNPQSGEEDLVSLDVFLLEAPSTTTLHTFVEAKLLSFGVGFWRKTSMHYSQM